MTGIVSRPQPTLADAIEAPGAVAVWAAAARNVNPTAATSGHDYTVTPPEYPLTE
jgi:hypothetical protein